MSAEVVSNIIPNSVLFNRKSPGKKGASCPLADKDPKEINYKNITLLSNFISERGRIIPSRISNLSAEKQRKIKNAIKRARSIALLPFSAC